MLFTTLRIFMLILSFLGYCAALRKKDIPMPFVPVLVLTGAGSLLFLAGILNLLPQTTVLLLAGGLLCAFRQKLWKDFSGLSRYDRICFAIFAGISLFFAWRLRGTVPLHYDNFTHWLRIIREVLDHDRFPNFQSGMIIFQSYPAGAAAFAYLICKVTGLYSDAAVLFSQAVMIAAALCTMLVFIKPFRFSSILVFALGCIFCVTVNPVADEAMRNILPGFVDISICEMLPDTLIAILSIASLSIVCHCRSNPIRGAWLSLPVQIYLISAKNSGLFLILFNTALLVYCAYQASANQNIRPHRQALTLAAIHSGIPILAFLLWNRHVAMVFESGTTAKHSVSLYYYRGMLGSKGFSGILEITKVFLKRFFSWSDSWLLLILCIAAFGAIFCIQRKLSRKDAVNTLRIFAGIVITYVVFMMALALMYLASMDYGEAIRLACYDRYEKTIIAYLAGAITVFLLSLLSSDSLQPHRKALSRIAVLTAVLLLLPQAARVPDLFVRRNPYEGSTRQFLEQTKDTYAIPDGARCLVCVDTDSETDVGYSGYLAQYVFWSNGVRVCYAEECDLPALESLVQGYDYFITQTHTPAIQQYLSQNGYPAGEAAYLLNPAAN